MNNTFIIIDTANLFHRARHGVRGDADLKIGMALHVIFNAVKNCWYNFQGTHLVFCFEGRSWRRDYYQPYKMNRELKRQTLTPKELEEEKLFYEVLTEFQEFITNKTNVTVLQHPKLEGDDLIAGFVQNHTGDKHIIISSDSDFQQLISTNVSQYDGMTDTHITKDGYFDAKGNQVLDKNKNPKLPIDPEWMLFEKCIRGDTSDNIFSAYPKVRLKSSKNKIGLLEAYNDRNSKGYAWNNLMLQRFSHHDGTEHRVIDDYNRNRMLIDLTQQPDDIRQIINEVINENAKPKKISQVGIRMRKFCSSYDMKKLVENINYVAEPFQSNYPPPSTN